MPYIFDSERAFTIRGKTVHQLFLRVFCPIRLFASEVNPMVILLLCIVFGVTPLAVISVSMKHSSVSIRDVMSVMPHEYIHVCGNRDTLITYYKYHA